MEKEKFKKNRSKKNRSIKQKQINKVKSVKKQTNYVLYIHIFICCRMIDRMLLQTCRRMQWLQFYGKVKLWQLNNSRKKGCERG